MILGVDGKRAHANLTGLGEYSRRLIKGLITLREDIVIRSLVPKVKIRFIDDERYRIFLPKYPIQRVWFRRFPPKDFFKDMDVYHGLSAEIPLNIPKGIGKVVTIHDLIYYFYPQWFSPFDRYNYHLRTCYAVKNSDVIIAVSKWTAESVYDVFKPKSDVYVIHPICDDVFFDVFKFREKPLNPPPKDYILFVGVLEERKNIHTLFKALNIIGKSCPTFVSVGRVKKPYMKNLLKEKRGIRWVHYNYLPTQQLLYLLSEALVFVYPSVVEGFGMPVVEAMAAGVPVITSKGSGLEDAAGNAALKVNPKDPEEMSFYLQKVIEDTSLRRSMIEEGKKHSQRFRYEAIIPKVMEIYKMVSNGLK